MIVKDFMKTKSNELVIRCGGYPDIDVYKFRDWIFENYFKIPYPYKDLFEGHYDVNIEFEVDDVYNFIYIRVKVIDTDDYDELSEDLKRSIRELSRGE